MLVIVHGYANLFVELMQAKASLELQYKVNIMHNAEVEWDYICTEFGHFIDPAAGGGSRIDIACRLVDAGANLDLQNMVISHYVR